MINTILKSLVPRSRLLHRVASAYEKVWNNEIDADPETNGEYAAYRRLMAGVKAPVLFDVGFNKGDYSRMMLSINPDAAVHAFDPDPQGSLDGVRLNVSAVGDKEGSLSFYRRGKSAHSSVYRTKSFVDRFEVPVTTIDRYCASNGIKGIDYLKIDTEGHELAVLLGAKGLIEAGRIGVIQFEVSHATMHSRAHVRDFFDLLGERYHIHRVMPGGLRRVDYALSEERFTYSNWIATLKRP